MSIKKFNADSSILLFTSEEIQHIVKEEEKLKILHQQKSEKERNQKVLNLVRQNRLAARTNNFNNLQMIIHDYWKTS